MKRLKVLLSILALTGVATASGLVFLEYQKRQNAERVSVNLPEELYKAKITGRKPLEDGNCRVKTFVADIESKSYGSTQVVINGRSVDLSNRLCSLLSPDIEESTSSSRKKAIKNGDILLVTSKECPGPIYPVSCNQLIKGTVEYYEGEILSLKDGSNVRHHVYLESDTPFFKVKSGSVEPLKNKNIKVGSVAGFVYNTDEIPIHYSAVKRDKLFLEPGFVYFWSSYLMGVYVF